MVEAGSIIVVLCGVAVALVLVGLDYFRRGSVVLAGSVLLAAFLRLFLPEREAGLLSSDRGKSTCWCSASWGRCWPFSPSGYHLLLSLRPLGQVS